VNTMCFYMCVFKKEDKIHQKIEATLTLSTGAYAFIYVRSGKASQRRRRTGRASKGVANRTLAILAFGFASEFSQTF
jgi:hypothetical protein